MRGLVIVAGVGAALAIPVASDVSPSPRIGAHHCISTHHKRSIFSRCRRSSIFGVGPSTALSFSATHVEAAASAYEDDGWARCLSIRGGAGERDWDFCTDYSTVGIINLLQLDDNEVGASLARHLEDELLPSSSLLVARADVGIGSKIFCLPREKDTSVLVGAFSPVSDDGACERMAPCETIGTLCDTTFLLLDGSKEGRDGEIDKIASFLNGIKRRLGGVPTGLRPRLVFYVQHHLDDDDNPQRYVTALLRSALARVSNKSGSDDLWSSIAELQRFADIAIIPYSPTTTLSEVVAAGKVFASQSEKYQPKNLPLSSFQMLARQVYHALSPNSDNADEIEFEALDASISANRDIVEAISSEQSEADYEEQIDGEATDFVDVPSYDDDDVQEEESIYSENSYDDTPVDEATSDFDPDMMFTQLTAASRRIIQTCEEKMRDLEEKQDEFLLNSEEGMPILEFGSDAQAIVTYAIEAFDQLVQEATLGTAVDDAIDKQINEMKESLMLDVAGDSGLRHLFELQLQSLREYYGRRYEAVLDEILDNPTNGDETRSKEKQEAILTAAAQRAADGFRTAASNAMPALCQDGALLEDLDYSIRVTRDLNGLLQDMIETTQARQELEEDWDDAATGTVDEESDEKESGKGSTKIQRQRKGPAKWYEKIAARALVLGVNYLQGWLALQQLRKAAADRDKAMPKFPLF